MLPAEVSTWRQRSEFRAERTSGFQARTCEVLPEVRVSRTLWIVGNLRFGTSTLRSPTLTVNKGLPVLRLGADSNRKISREGFPYGHFRTTQMKPGAEAQSRDCKEPGHKPKCKTVRNPFCRNGGMRNHVHCQPVLDSTATRVSYSAVPRFSTMAEHLRGEMEPRSSKEKESDLEAIYLAKETYHKKRGFQYASRNLLFSIYYIFLKD